jgi:hypothetical protein
MMSSPLTAEERRKIEVKKQEALAKTAKRTSVPDLAQVLTLTLLAAAALFVALLLAHSAFPAFSFHIFVCLPLLSLTILSLTRRMWRHTEHSVGPAPFLSAQLLPFPIYHISSHFCNPFTRNARIADFVSFGMQACSDRDLRDHRHHLRCHPYCYHYYHHCHHCGHLSTIQTYSLIGSTTAEIVGCR